MRWTVTAFDGLGRTTVITAPDSTRTDHYYGIAASAEHGGRLVEYHDVLDANRHRTQSRSDAQGRLVSVVELSGNCDDAGFWGGRYACAAPHTSPWGVYATSVYTYTGKDLLAQVRDAHGNLTSMAYDSQGRKTSMADPDMGTWSYAYDANSNMLRQTDARGQRICMYYDALNRLTGKHYRSDDACPASPSLDVSYSYDSGSNGKGRRTGMAVASGASTAWQYDARGNKVQAAHTVPGLSGTRTFNWGYDSAGRIRTLTYPAIGAAPRETLTYSYDDAGRPADVCSSLGTCYVSSAAYTAQDRPILWAMGNGLNQQWTYAGPLERLQRSKVGSGGIFDRTYTYDAVGNIRTISDNLLFETQSFSYDHRDRLTRARTGAPAASLQEALTADQAAALDAEPAGEVGQTQEQPERAAEPSADAYGRLPLAFVPNGGQSDAHVRFQARGLGGDIFFTPTEIVLAVSTPLSATATADARAADPSDAPVPLAQSVVRLRYEQANPSPVISSTARLPGVVNYLTGADRSAWRTNVPTYAGLVYQQLYPGIDLHYDGSDGQLKSTYVVAPGVDPSQIGWRYAGATRVALDEGGNLRISLPLPAKAAAAGRDGITLTEHAPIAWQDRAGGRVPVDVRYTVAPNGRIGFALGDYDRSLPLTIDPTLTYSTFLGGSGSDAALAVVHDSAGNIYITGNTASADFPTGQGGQSGFSGTSDAFVTKLDASGAVVYSTYLGGANYETGRGIAVDTTGSALITGSTASTDFPTSNPLQGTNQGANEAFVTKLSPDGTALVYSTYLGGSGSDYGDAIALDADGNALVTGRTASANFPTQSPLDSTLGGSQDAFVSKLSPSGAALLASTYVGGSAWDGGAGIAVDTSGNSYVVGTTASSDFPTHSPADGSANGSRDAFVFKLNPAGSALVYSTYLGGSGYDEGAGIAIDDGGQAYVTGTTFSSNFPAQLPLQATRQGLSDAFVARLSAAGSALGYSTYLGGTDAETGRGIAVDEQGRATIVGDTASGDFPTAAPLQLSYAGTPGSGKTDAFVATLDSAGADLSFSTYLGGAETDAGYAISLAADGSAAIAGSTASSDFPTQHAGDATYSGGTSDAFVAHISSGADYDETYVYNAIGNLLSKAGVAYAYPAAGDPRPHTPHTVGGQSYTYDTNGNLLNGGGRTYTWDADNRPQTITSGGVAEQYAYDGDGERVRSTRSTTTTVYLEGMWEEEVVGGGVTVTYPFNGQMVAVRDSATTTLTYLHSDHLGSISAATTAGGALASRQQFTPWGAPRGPEMISATRLNYTGQRRDATGLLYYHARYYDPVLGRFVSPDTLVPDQSNPQDFNRYSYVKNNPIRYNDPSGHCIPYIGDCRPVWEAGGGPNWHDVQQYSAGVVEGMGAAGATVVQTAQTLSDPATYETAGRGLQALISDPLGSAQVLGDAAIDQGKALYDQAAAVASDPAAAVVALNDDPRALGRTLGATAGDLALAAATKPAAAAKPAAAKPVPVRAAPCTNSFTPDTPVATAAGAQPIGALTIGDHVLAWDEATRTTGRYTITAVLVHRDPVLVHLLLEGETIVTTPEHPFFTLAGRWTDAAQLRPGLRVRRADGRYGAVQAVRFERRSTVMYNLTVATAHTFFVGAGRWLVHNASCRIPLKNGASELAEGAYWEDVSILVHANPPDQLEKLVKARKNLQEGWDPKRVIGIEIQEDGTKLVNNGNHRLAVVKEMGYNQVPTKVLWDKRKQ